MDGNGKLHPRRVTQVAVCKGDHGPEPYCYGILMDGEWYKSDGVEWKMIAQDPHVIKVYGYCEECTPPAFHL